MVRCAHSCSSSISSQGMPAITSVYRTAAAAPCETTVDEQDQPVTVPRQLQTVDPKHPSRLQDHPIAPFGRTLAAPLHRPARHPARHLGHQPRARLSRRRRQPCHLRPHPRRLERRRRPPRRRPRSRGPQTLASHPAPPMVLLPRPEHCHLGRRRARRRGHRSRRCLLLPRPPHRWRRPRHTRRLRPRRRRLGRIGHRTVQRHPHRRSRLSHPHLLPRPHRLWPPRLHQRTPTGSPPSPATFLSDRLPTPSPAPSATPAAPRYSPRTTS
jgi:hypothetical protein